VRGLAIFRETTMMGHTLAMQAPGQGAGASIFPQAAAMTATRKVLDIQSPDSAARSSLDAADLDDEEPVDWSEEDIVLLHWRLLQEVNRLADPATPLEEKFDTLRWVFTERSKDDRPFSFASCLRVVGCSPLSPIAYCGRVDAEEIRDRIRLGVRSWLPATLLRYPEWVRQAVASNPQWVATRLERNPQWINEQLKRIADEGDLFA
jgi:hypothetical protein